MPREIGAHAENDDVSRRRILIVEDNQVNAMILKAMLRRDGWDPLFASDGIEGIEMTEQFRPRLILMDLQMPRLDGFAAAREIFLASAEAGALGPPVIVAVTATPGRDVRDACAAAGFAELIAKPIEMDTLLAVVRRYMGPA
jgi:CheY-like chemotaxis protein